MKTFARRLLSALVAVGILCTGMLSCLAAEVDGSFVKWTEDNWTKPDGAVTHLGLSTATDADGNWTNYRYLAQEFVPAESNISGAKIVLNLTGGDATVHTEIRKEVNGEAIFESEISITSLGNGRFWYTLPFHSNVTVTPGETYYLVWYLTKRTEGNVCIAYGSDVGAAGAEHPGYVYAMKDGGDVLFNAGAGNMIYSFELITEYDETGYFTKWNEETWSKEDQVITHLGLSTADDSDSNWGNYRYIAQEFVPVQNNISGAKIVLNLTAGNATVHTEIRSEINGEALFEKDIDIESKGNGRNWYTLPFETNVSVLSGETYYLVWYLTDRTPSSVCIAYGSDIGNAEHPGYQYKMSDGGDVIFTAGAKNLVFSFELIADQVEEPSGRHQWHSFDEANNITHEQSRTENLFVEKENYLEGTGAFGLTGRSDNNKEENGNAQVFFYLYPGTLDVRNTSYVTFDLYLSEEIKSGNMLDAGFNVSNSDVWDANGKICEASVIKSIDWQVGWNHVVLPIDWSLTSDFNQKELKRARFYMIYNGSFSGVTFMMDDLCFVEEDWLEDNTNRNIAKDIIIGIKSLPAVDQLALADGETINALMTAYNGLANEYKQIVYNRELLLSIKNAYDDLTADALAINERIAALPTADKVSEVFTEELAEIRALYNGLTDTQKAFVSDLDKLSAVEEALVALSPKAKAVISAADMGSDAASYATSYGELIGWQVDPGQINNWILFNFTHTFGAGNYKLAAKVRFKGVTDEKQEVPVISLKCSDNTTGEAEVLKKDLGMNEYKEAELDADGFGMIYSEPFTVTEEMASHALEGKVLAYTEFHENLELVLAGLYWVDADDPGHIYKSLELADIEKHQAKGLTGKLVYNDNIQRIEYVADPSVPATDEPGYIFSNLKIENQTAGEYFADIAFKAQSGENDLFELEVYDGDNKIAGQLVNASQVGSMGLTSDGLTVARVSYELKMPGDITFKVYQFNGGDVSYRNIRTYQTSEIQIDEAVVKVIEAIDALPSVMDVTLDDVEAVKAAEAMYNALNSEQKEQVSNYQKLTALLSWITPPNPALDLGDVNDDGDINAKDALLILQFAVNKVELTAEQQTAADVTHDGIIDAKDALQVLKYSVGKITEF